MSNSDSGINSVIEGLSNNRQSSFFYSSLDHVFDNETKDVFFTDEKDTDLLFSGNCSDLWKYLRMFRKRFTDLFTQQDRKLIDHSLILGSILCLRDVYLKLQPNSQPRQKMKAIVANKIKNQIDKNIDWTIFECPFILNYVLQQQSFKDANYYSQFKTQFILLRMKKVDCLTKYLKLVVSYFYRNIRKIETPKNSIAEKNKIQIMILCCYLKLYLGCQSWISLSMGNPNINQLVFMHLATLKGSKKVIRFTEDTINSRLEQQIMKTTQILN